MPDLTMTAVERARRLDALDYGLRRDNKTCISCSGQDRKSACPICHGFRFHIHPVRRGGSHSYVASLAEVERFIRKVEQVRQWQAELLPMAGEEA